MYLIREYKTFYREHNLSGIALMVDDKICIVLPKKFKRSKKYSIPKGHIEPQYTPYYNAYIELKEETGIDIGLSTFDSKFNYSYKKNGILKKMEVFVVKLTKSEYENLDKGNRNKKEIIDVLFVSKKKALLLSENRFKKLIRYIFN